MDDNTYSEANANSETAPTAAPTGALIVTATGSKDKDKFTDCYFTVNGLSWILYSKGGTQLASGTSTDTSFTFNHDLLKGSSTNKIAWTTTSCTFTVSNNSITGISGSWSNNDDDEPTAGAQSGSFEASSGGEIDPETASASASA